MKKFIESITFKVVVVLVIILAGLMVYSAANPDRVSLAEKAATIITVPFQKLASSVSSSVSSFFTGLFRGGEIMSENERLISEIEKLRYELVNYENCKKENERLEALLEIKKEKPELSLISADIIGRDTDDYGTSFTIGAGSLNGVELRDAVITRAGMVGVVTDVYPTSAKVTTVLSTNLSIGAKIVRTHDTGVVSGVTSWALNNTVKLSYISRESTVSKGDIIVTSGVSGLYPENLILGTVQAVEPEDNGISLYAVVTAAEDINDLDSVYVVKGYGEEAENGEGSGENSGENGGSEGESGE